VKREKQVVDGLSQKRKHVEREWNGDVLINAGFFVFIGLVCLFVLGLIIYGYISAYIYFQFKWFLCLLLIPIGIGLFIFYFGYWGNRVINHEVYQHGQWIYERKEHKKAFNKGPLG